MWNLIRWVSPRTIKETLVPPTRLPLPVPAARRMTRAAPGLALAGVGVALSLGAHRARSGAFRRSSSVWRSGSRSRTWLACPGRAAPGLKIAAGRCSSSASSSSGFDLVFPDILALGFRALLVVVAVVAITFVGTRWARPTARRLATNLSLLVATGFSICGVSAIAAANGVVDADEDEVDVLRRARDPLRDAGDRDAAVARRHRSVSTTSSTAPGSARACTTLRRSSRPRRRPGALPSRRRSSSS